MGGRRRFLLCAGAAALGVPARAIDLSTPQALLVRADEVIQ